MDSKVGSGEVDRAYWENWEEEPEQAKSFYLYVLAQHNREMLEQSLGFELTSKSLYDGDWNLTADMKLSVKGDRGKIGTKQMVHERRK